MSRLIDADLLKENCKYTGKFEDNFCCVDLITLAKVIDAQPTAYDVNNVVEQLEEVGQKMSESKSIQKYGKSSPANHRYYKAVSVKRAIEIVKGGGVNEC